MAKRKGFFSALKDIRNKHRRPTVFIPAKMPKSYHDLAGLNPYFSTLREGVKLHELDPDLYDKWLKAKVEELHDDDVLAPLRRTTESSGPK